MVSPVPVPPFAGSGHDPDKGCKQKTLPGDTMKIMGPLGNGFTVEKGRKAFLIGGGIGVPPMLQLAKEMKDAGENFQIVMRTGS